MPIADEQKTAFFGHPFRTQVSNAPHGFGFERARALISSILALWCKLEQHFREFCCSGAGSSGHMRQMVGFFKVAVALGQALNSRTWRLQGRLRRTFHTGWFAVESDCGDVGWSRYQTGRLDLKSKHQDFKKNGLMLRATVEM